MEGPLLQAVGLLDSLLDLDASAGAGLSPAARQALGRLGARLEASLSATQPAAPGEEEEGAGMAVDGGGGDSSKGDITLVLPSSVLVSIAAFLLPRTVGAATTYFHRFEPGATRSKDLEAILRWHTKHCSRRDTQPHTPPTPTPNHRHIYTYNPP